MLSGGHLVAKALKTEGVDTIFTLCGGHIIDIYDGCVDEGIRIIDVRHEQVAAHAADGYARQTGKLGCVVTTAGPGCMNAMTGIATAFRSESPVLHIGGQSALTQRHDGLAAGPAARRHHEADHQAIGLGPQSPSAIADMVSMAARECFAGAYGPSYLEIPRDVLDREIDATKAVHSAARPLPRLHQIDRRPRRYRETGRHPGQRRTPGDPVGPAGLDRPRSQEAIDLLRGLDIPGYFNGAGRGLLPPGDPHHFDRTRREGFDKADVIVIVGTPFDFRMGYGKPHRPRRRRVVQIDMDYRTVGKNRDVALGLVGDPGAILGAVLQAASGRLKNDKRQARKEWMARPPASWRTQPPKN